MLKLCSIDMGFIVIVSLLWNNWINAVMVDSIYARLKNTIRSINLSYRKSGIVISGSARQTTFLPYSWASLCWFRLQRWRNHYFAALQVITLGRYVNGCSKTIWPSPGTMSRLKDFYSLNNELWAGCIGTRFMNWWCEKHEYITMPNLEFANEVGWVPLDQGIQKGGFDRLWKKTATMHVAFVLTAIYRS